MFKIIRRDNFDREGPGYDDVLVCGHIQDPGKAARAANALNLCYPTDHPYIYEAVSQDYKLKKFEP